MQSVLAVLAGFVTMTVIVIVCTVVLARAWMSSPQGGYDVDARSLPPAYLTANLLCSAFAALAGGYLTAVLADNAPLAHGIALAVLMMVMSAFSMRQSAGRQPRWYAMTLMLVMPLIAIGGAFLQTVIAGAL
jgi:hypothetical protein